MSSFMQNKRLVLITLGAGVLIGSGATWWVLRYRLIDNIDRLRLQVDLLRRELEHLRAYVEERLAARKQRQITRDPPTPCNSPVPPTSEEDEVYEEAYDGPVPWLANLGSDQLKRTDSLNDLPTNTTIDSLYNRVDKLLDGNDMDKGNALRLLHEHEQDLVSDVSFLWRLAKATYFMSQIEAFRDKQRQKTLVYKSKDYATQALSTDDNCANAHKWYAITLGSVGDYEGTTVKIQNGYQFKNHIERAIQLNPTDPTGHYLLGRWCFGVYMLSWVERKMAATLFTAPPTATVEDALNNFLEADRLNPGVWKENLLFIAKCYIQKRDYASAIEWLDKADRVAIQGKDDEECQKEVDSLLRQYGSYRRNAT